MQRGAPRTWHDRAACTGKETWRFSLSIPRDLFNVERTKEEPSRQLIHRSRLLKHWWFSVEVEIIKKTSMHQNATSVSWSPGALKGHWRRWFATTRLSEKDWKGFFFSFPIKLLNATNLSFTHTHPTAAACLQQGKANNWSKDPQDTQSQLEGVDWSGCTWHTHSHFVRLLVKKRRLPGEIPLPIPQITTPLLKCWLKII